MSELNIKYKDTSIATLDASGTKTCQTSGKYLEGDIVVEYTRPNTSTQSKIALPTNENQIITPDSGYIGLSQVNMSRVTTTNLEAGNIASGVTIEVGNPVDSSAVASVTGTATLLAGETRDEAQSSKIATYTPSTGKNAITSIKVTVSDGSAGNIPVSGSASLSTANITTETTNNSGISLQAIGTNIKGGSATGYSQGYISSGATTSGTGSNSSTVYLKEITVPSSKTLNKITNNGAITNIVNKGTLTVSPDMSSGGSAKTYYTDGGVESDNTGLIATVGGTSGNTVNIIQAANTTITNNNSEGGTTTINYTAGNISATNLSAANIKSGVSILGVDGSYTGPTLSGDASASNVLSGKTFYSNSYTKQTGTIPSKAAATYTPGSSVQTIAAGQYLSGAQTISAVKTEAISVNDIGSTYTPSSGKYFNYVEVGNSLHAGIGVMAEIYGDEDAQIAVYDSLQMENPIIITEGESSSTTTFAGDTGRQVHMDNHTGATTITNLSAGNIASGVTVFGVTGTLEKASDYTTETSLSGSLSGSVYTVSTPNTKGKHTSKLYKDVTPTTLGFTLETALDGSLSGTTYTVSTPQTKGCHTSQLSKAVTKSDLGISDMVLPTGTEGSGIGTQQAVINPSGSGQYLNIPTGYNGSDIHYRVRSVYGNNFYASNIKKGVTVSYGTDGGIIQSVTGTAEVAKTGYSSGVQYSVLYGTYSSSSSTLYKRTFSTTEGGMYVVAASSTGTYNLYSNGQKLPTNTLIYLGRAEYKYSSTSSGSISNGNNSNVYLYNTGTQLKLLSQHNAWYGNGYIIPIQDIVLESATSTTPTFTQATGSSGSVTKYSYVYTSSASISTNGEKKYCSIPSDVYSTSKYYKMIKAISYSTTSSSISASMTLGTITWN